MAGLNCFSPAYASSPDSFAPSPASSSTSTTPLIGPMSTYGQPAAARPQSMKAPNSSARGPPAPRRQGKAVKALPAPLTEALLLQAMTDLPDGTRRATVTCYQCFQNNKFTLEDFISFLRSIANQSRTLARIFNEFKMSSEASARHAHTAEGASTAHAARDQHGPLSGASSGGGGVIRAGAMAGCLGDLGLSDDDDDEPAVDMTAKLIRRRRREARRRQLGCYPGSLAEKQSHFLANMVRRLRAKIPTTSKAKLLSAVRSYADHVTSPEEFCDMLQALVDEHGIIVELDYMPEHEARAVSAKDLEQARIRSNRTNVTQAQARKRSAGQQASSSEAAGKRIKADMGTARPALTGGMGMAAMEALDVPSLQEDLGIGADGRGSPACELGMSNDSYGGRCAQCGSSRQSDKEPGCSRRGRGGFDDTPGRDTHTSEPWRTGYDQEQGRHPHHPSQRPGPGSEAMRASMGVAAAARNAYSSGPAPSPNDLPGTALGNYLTQQAQMMAPPDREVRVRVVSQTENSTGGGCAQRYSYRCKSIMAFQKLDGAQVIFFGMYVHEFGPHAPAPAAGCVYIECLDSIPLHGDRPVDRQQLLTTIVHSYLRFIKSQGFRSVHIRVPPPSAENSHIFAYRSLKIRIEATLRMAQWFKRLLDSAVQLGVVNSFEGESHLSKLESFPPCILPAADIAEEHAFSAMRSTAAKLCESGDQEGVDASVLQRLVSFKERFFVAHLTSEDSPSPHRLEPDESPLHPCPVVSRRRDLIAAFARERLSFTTPESAKFATRFILCRLAAFAQSGAPMPPAGCGLDDKMPDWVHRQQQLPTLDDSAMDFDEYSASHKNEGMDSEGASKQTCIPTAGEPHMSSRLKMEDGPGVVITSSLGDNLLLDGAELVRGSLDGVLEPLGDLDDAELFADSLFSA